MGGGGDSLYEGFRHPQIDLEQVYRKIEVSVTDCGSSLISVTDLRFIPPKFFCNVFYYQVTVVQFLDRKHPMVVG